MKKSLLVILPLFLSLISKSQYEFGIGIGSTMLLKKPADVDVQSAINIAGYVQREFRLAHSLIFEPRISVISGRYFTNVRRFNKTHI